MLTAGTVIGGYRIERVLGSGGMGSVYLAAHPTLPRYDALKVLSAELSRDPDFRQRFTREADVASSLDHPQIVSIYNRGQTDDGQLWIAMQFVDGTDADAALRAGTMTPHRAVHIVTEVAKALDFAHQHNVVHRDIKPANFLLSGPAGPAERVLLGDFGIARALDDIGLTATGAVLATVSYAAPEVLSGLPFDGRADLYSLGCTLYRLLTGKTPFGTGNGPAAVMMAHLQQPPPRVTEAVPSLPAALDRVLAVAMAKDPWARFPTAGALAAAAADALREPTTGLWVPMPPVPSGDVSSYPRFDSGAQPPWWHQPAGGTGTAMAPQPGGVVAHTPTPPSRRRRYALTGALAAVILLVAATVTVIAWPRGDSAPGTASKPTSSSTPPQGPPATDVGPLALRSILLTAAEVPGNTGEHAIVLERDGTDLLDDSATIDNRDCLSAWAPAQQPVYAGSGYTGAAVQVLREVNASITQNSLIQSVASFESQDKAVTFVQAQQRQWTMCSSRSATVTPTGEAPQMAIFGLPLTNAGAITLNITLGAPSPTPNCQRGIAARGNVVIDVRQCRSGGNDATAIVASIADKVPRQ